ncbi:MAG: 16S rRNA processing protein RimM [Chloroflexi bacterium]|jgi:16S rRNA processing protein RimM|nr:16S rRNA processing protein RimM [Chloroflexota bacterium]
MLTQQPEPRYLAVGRVLRPHGIRGELRVQVFTDFPEHLAEISHVYLGPTYRRMAIEKVRFHKNRILLKLAGLEDRDAAETFRDQTVYVAMEDAVPLEEEEYYHFQVVGMQVETEDGEALGEVVEVLAPPGANDVFVVHGPRGEILIPAIEDAVREIDFDAMRMVIIPMPGLLD